MPKLLTTPFASEATSEYRTDVQNSTGAEPNSATYEQGFPPVTMEKIAMGGKPPKGSDLNGVLYDITDNLVALTKGARYVFNEAYATAIGGYPLGAVLRLDNGVEVESEVDANSINPNVDMTGWKLAVSDNGIVTWSGRTQREKNKDTVNLSDFLVGGKSVEEALDEAFSVLVSRGGGTLQVLAGSYPISRTIIVPSGVLFLGDGKCDTWEEQSVGVKFYTVGSGNPQKWTDIFDGDTTLETPMFVAGGNAVYFEDIYLETNAENPWSVGLLFPCVKQCGFNGLQTSDNFTNTSVLLDVTWSSTNTTLTSLHPTVKSSTGMNEFEANDFALKSNFGLKIQGSTRNPDDYTDEQWVWGWGGASDVRLKSGRVTGMSFDGALKNAAKAIQGIWVHNVTPRLGSKEVMLNFGRVNRISFTSCYAEASTSNTTKINFTSNTGEVNFYDSKFIRNNVWIDGVNTNRALGSSFPELPLLNYWGTDGNAHLGQGINISGGSIYPSTNNTGSLGTSSLNYSAVRVQQVRSDSDLLTLRAGGSIEFKPRNATTTLIADNVSLRPNSNGAISLGTSAYNYSKVWAQALSITYTGVFEDNASAKAGGLSVGEHYRTATGVVMVVY